MMIQRPRYMEKIRPFLHQPVIKVLTGMRRVGKSTMLELLREEVLKAVPKENILMMNLESFEYLSVQTAEEFAREIRRETEGRTGRKAFFFDEVQKVKGWERVVNALQADPENDIYLTGSNSTMLSGELATLLAGRTVSFEIQPFTFQEFSDLYKNTRFSQKDLFDKFLVIGGMPLLRYFGLEEAASMKYLSDVYHTVLVKDVLEYNRIRDVDIFERILSFATENVGGIFSANGIRKYLASEGRKVTVDTVLNYLEYCRQAFLLRKVQRFDLTGKKLLKIDEKYYLTDHGFRQARGFSNRANIERVLENIVYIELVSRGYEVSIGKVGDREIDFIAKRDGALSYYQVAYLIPTEETREREFGVYREVRDNHPKYVLSMDPVNFSQDGVIHRNLLDFLQEDL